MSMKGKLSHLYTHGWANTRTYRKFDAFTQQLTGRPDRETRYENRKRMAREALHGSLLGASFLVGTGRARAGSALVGAGLQATKQSGQRLAGWGLWPRARGNLAIQEAPKLVSAARDIGTGLLMQRQGNFLRRTAYIGLAYDYGQKKGWL